MTDNQGKTLKKDFIDRFDKAIGRLQQSVPEIQRFIKASNVVEAARKIIDPAQSIFRQFADDIQLKDLFAKAEALVANANLTFTKAVSKGAHPTETFRDETSSKESSKKAEVKKTPSKGRRSKKRYRRRRYRKREKSGL